MNSKDKLLSSCFLIKKAYANYLEMGRQMGGQPSAPTPPNPTMVNSQPAFGFNGAAVNGASPGGRLTQAGPEIAARAVPMQDMLAAPQAAAPAPRQTGIYNLPPRIRLNQADVGNLQSSFKNDLAKHFGNQPPAAPAAAGPNVNDMFSRFMGSPYDANSKVDRAKMEYLKRLQNKFKGQKLTASMVYNKNNGYGKF